jgi:hypothetical protein
MAKSIAILDTWLLMVACNIMVLLAAAEGYGLTTRHGNGSWAVVAVCLLEAGITVGMIAGFVRPQGGGKTILLLLRILFAAVLAWLLWLQPRPWLDFRDWEATDREFMLQRIQQVAYFLVFTAAFVTLGFAHAKTTPNPAAAWPPSQKRRSFVIIVAFGLALSITIRLSGMLRPGNGAVAGIGIVSAVTIMLFECARRVVRVEGGAFVGFAVVTSAMPLILFWPQF